MRMTCELRRAVHLSGSPPGRPTMNPTASNADEMKK